jgi:hypothetical protein
LYSSSAAAVEEAKARLETARLNLSYCTIVSPVTGITSAAVQQDGTYVSPLNSLLTTVAVLSPIWINFSISEMRCKDSRPSLPRVAPSTQGHETEVEVILIDGSLFPYTGEITAGMLKEFSVRYVILGHSERRQFFGEKYGEHVRVVMVADFSIELCGGTHTSRTGDIGLFKIVNETGVAAGVRRIEALTGEGAYRFIKEEERELLEIASLLKSIPGELSSKVERLFQRERELLYPQGYTSNSPFPVRLCHCTPDPKKGPSLGPGFRTSSLEPSAVSKGPP